MDTVPTFDWLHELSPDVWQAVHEGGFPLGVLADWLEERGWTQDAEDVRRLAASYATLPQFLEDARTAMQRAVQGARNLTRTIGPFTATTDAAAQEAYAALVPAFEEATRLAIEALLATDTEQEM
jgi:hypothetical protein